MLIDRIERARLTGVEGVVDLEMVGGRVAAVTARAGDRIEGDRPADVALVDGALDVGGRVVVPGLVDAHVHLDKAFLRAPVLGPARLEHAIAEVDRLRARTSRDELAANARRAVDVLVRHGVVAARVHAEVEPRVGLDLVELQLALADEVADRCRLQLVAFPQLGLETAGAADRLAEAMALGTTVVGGCPYVDTDPAHHLDVVFALAEKHQAPVDLHLDFTDDHRRSQLDLVVERTNALGMAGAVVVGHVTTLSAMAPDDQQRALDRMASAGIGLVAVPATDLYLGGHGEPGTRSLAPVERAIAAGVTVAIANNNLGNSFSPYGNGSLLQAAWLTGITRRVADPDLLLAAVTSGPAALVGLADHGPRVGATADLAVLATADPHHLVAQCPAVVATVVGGTLVEGARP